MIDNSDAIQSAVGRVRILEDGAGGVTIDVPGHREGSARWTSVERVAWVLVEAFLRGRPESGDFFTTEAVYAWRARAADDLALALKKGELFDLDLERYLQETKYA